MKISHLSLTFWTNLAYNSFKWFAGLRWVRLATSGAISVRTLARFKPETANPKKSTYEFGCSWLLPIPYMNPWEEVYL